MEFRVLLPSPVIILEDGSEFRFETVGRGKPSAKLAKRYQGLLRYLVLAACSARRPADGLVDREAAAAFLSNESDVNRAISDIRKALALTGAREPVYGTAKGGGGVPTDESFIRSDRAGMGYGFLLHPPDKVDWVECQRDIELAGQHLASGNTSEALAHASRWEEVLLPASNEPVGALGWDPLWVDVLLARLRMLRILAIAAGAENAFALVLVRAEEVARGDTNRSVYDSELAEAAVRAQFALDGARAGAVGAIDQFFLNVEVPLPQVIKEFANDVEDKERDWNEIRDTWFERWRIPRLEARAESPPQPTIAVTRSGNASPGHRRLVDVLTPGFSVAAFQADIQEMLDPELASQITDTARRAVTSVEQGDFVLQEQVGREFLVLADHVPQLAAAGHYFVAEGLRLQADLVTGSERHNLLQAAKGAYQLSSEFDPTSVRATRGLARTWEVLGDPEEAVKWFQIGHVQARLQLIEVDNLDDLHRYELSHEVLRVTRHLVHCLAELRNSDEVALRQFGQSDDTLHALAIESASLHRDRLPMFGAYKRWSQIEWFMGLTLLAKSYAAIGDHENAARELVFALLARLNMLGPDHLTPVDVANLRWWAATARNVAREPVPGWTTALEQLQAALSDGTDARVRAALENVQRIVAPMRPPIL